MTTWPAKDPDAVLDYRFTVPLGDGDAIDTLTLTVASGTAVIDDQSNDAAGVTAFISGGADGETARFLASWTTTGGREDEESIFLPIVDGAGLAAKLAIRYPAFKAVDRGVAAYWITDAKRSVPEAWGGDYEPALLALAAHQLELNGYGSSDADTAEYKQIKSGDLTLTRFDDARGFNATRYGREYEAIARRHSLGLVTGAGVFDGAA